jgi:transposase-like protein
VDTDQVLAMVKMREQGMTFSQIAAVVGVHATTVWRRLYGMGRPTRGHPLKKRISRLRDAGLSYRKIGRVVKLSHERVRQIIDGV